MERSAHSFVRRFSTRRPLWHSQVNLLSTPVAPHQLPSSPYFTPLSTCCNSILLSSSSHWTFPRRSTPSDTPRCCPRWLNSTCRRLSTTGWWTFSAATRTIPCLVEMSRAPEASRPASYRARTLDQPPTLSQQLISETRYKLCKFRENRTTDTSLGGVYRPIPNFRKISVKNFTFGGFIPLSLHR